MVTLDLSDKTALITGAGQGIGASTALFFSHAGAQVVINYVQDPKGINRKRAEQTAETMGRNALVVEADIRNPKAVKDMFKRSIDHFGSLHIVVNNAGIIRDRTTKKMSSEEWQAVIDTNLTGTFNVCREAATKLHDGGRIVNLSSISGVIGFFGQSNYAASKAGIIGLTRVLCRELAMRQITVNAVAPGLVLTEMGLTIPHEVRTEMLKSIPLGRFGKPEEIAGVILFLCSDLASYITGQVIHVNGGWIG
jgi:3-oxoacyl-[acyl-carrier protein] reductase